MENPKFEIRNPKDLVPGTNNLPIGFHLPLLPLSSAIHPFRISDFGLRI